MSDQLNEFITAQHTTNVTLATAMARIEQKLDDNSGRLFGAPGQKGALQYLHEEHEELETKVAAVSTRTGALETWRSGTLKWVAGVMFVLTAEGTALAFWFNHLTALIPHK